MKPVPNFQATTKIHIGHNDATSDEGYSPAAFLTVNTMLKPRGISQPNNFLNDKSGNTTSQVTSYLPQNSPDFTAHTSHQEKVSQYKQ